MDAEQIPHPFGQGTTRTAQCKNYEIFLWHICFALLHSRALEELKQIL
jgi:hypothetical protein